MVWVFFLSVVMRCLFVFIVNLVGVVMVMGWGFLLCSVWCRCIVCGLSLMMCLVDVDCVCVCVFCLCG